MDQIKRDAKNAKRRENYARRSSKKIEDDMVKSTKKPENISDGQKSEKLAPRQPYANISDKIKAEKALKRNAKRRENYARRSSKQIEDEMLKSKRKREICSDTQKSKKLVARTQRYANISDKIKAEKALTRNAKRRANYSRRCPKKIYNDGLPRKQKRANSFAKKKSQKLVTRRKHPNASRQTKTTALLKRKQTMDISDESPKHQNTNEIQSQEVGPRDNLTDTNDEFQCIKQQYDTIIKTWPSTPCSFCDRMMYPIGLRRTVLKSQHIETLHSYNICDYGEGSVILICHTCHVYLQKKKMSGQSKHNFMQVPKSPACISELTQMEVRLISQVKLHLQIFRLCNNTGQFGMKGTVIHFAQAINELAYQLPLTSVQSEVVVVAETLEAVTSRREFAIRPDYILKSLYWLKANNPLYKNVEIVERHHDELSLRNIVVLDQPTVEVSNDSHYVTNDRYAILRGTFRRAQANSYMFPSNAGKQCTSNCATFIAYANFQNLNSWNSNILDQILLDGDKYYSHIIESSSDFTKQAIISNSGFLNCEEIAGNILVQNNVTFNLQICCEDALSLNGVLQRGRKFHFNNQRVNIDLPTLENAIQYFLGLDVQSCILTTSQYSMAICKQQNSAYYFDPHSRTATGRVCTTANGLACLIKFPINTAAKSIASLVHVNVQSKCCITKEYIKDPILAEAEKYNFVTKFAFAITPVIAARVHKQLSQLTFNENVEAPNILTNQTNEAVSTTQAMHSHDLGFGLPQHIEQVLPHNNRAADKFHCNDTDSIQDLDTYFLHNIDHNEPEIENYLQNFLRGSALNPMQLHRSTGPPIKPYLEKHLEELSFVTLFPHGTHGFNEERRQIKQSPLKYFQARIMSSDSRFHSKEYLCYALDRIEHFKIEQQIGIVCNMTNQRRNNNETQLIPGANNPHLYLKAIRGGASYWKNFGGDVFAMVNMLGVPTFWITFSTDDVNSPELMNAIWKSEHGDDSECPFESLQYCERKKLLDDHPVLAARYFCTKAKQVINIIEKHGMVLFGRNVTNHIARIEFQVRGSGHLHGMFWCENQPDFKTIEGVEFINKNVSVSLHGENHELVTKYQTHKHTRTCFKNTNLKVCRFDFPRDAHDETKLLSKEETHKNHGRSVQYATKTDEININNYHPKLLSIIRSNMDIQVVGDVNDVIFYIAKYISKAEPEKLASDLQDALVAAKASTSETVRQNLLNVANVVTRNRQIGLPEAAFRVLGLPLRFCSKSFQFVSAYKKDKRYRLIQKERLKNNKTVVCMNIFERYELRPDTEEMKNMCLFEFAALFDPKQSTAYDDVDEEMEEDFNVIESNANKRNESIQLLDNKGVMVRRKNPKVVKFPMFNTETQSEEYHYSLLLMFLPFREEDELLQGYESASNAFLEKKQLLMTEDNSSIIKIGLREELDRALLRLRENMEYSNVLNFENLNCDDELYIENCDFQDNNNQLPENIVDIIDSRTATFSSEQKQVFKLVRKQIQMDTKSGTSPLRLFISGEGGTGKSYVIQTLALFIRNMLHGVGDPLQIAAPTACAAIPISGLTLHRSFGIPVEMGHKVPPYRKFSAETLQSYRRRYKFLKWIILDEASMISYETFEYISRRLQDIFESSQPFGNINMLVFGDILQLKPCNGNWIYKHPTSMRASTDLWRLFGFVELKVNHRQTGSDPLKGICSRLRVGNTTSQDISHLMTRVIGKESTWDQKTKDEWKDVIRIYPTNKLADNCNNAHIEALKSSGLKIYTVNAFDKYADGNDIELPPPQVIPENINKTAGIPTQLQIGISVRIMLRCNLSLDDKLVNGSRGAIKAITWPRLLPDQSHDGQLPQSISVLFDDPTAGGHLKDKSTNLVRIEPRLFDFIDKRGRKIHRMMLPCILVAGITCHKVQGQTVSRAVIHLQGWNIFKGGAYVALSRCTTLQGLAITEFDTSELIATETFCPAEKSSMEEYSRLRELPLVH